MTRPHLFACAVLTSLRLSAAFDVETLPVEASQIRSVSEGSDCRCSCVLKPIDYGPCPDKPGRRNIRYTIDTVSGGSDCRCSCFAPAPTNICQKSSYQTDRTSPDDDAIIGSSNRDAEVKRAITASDLNVIRSSFRDMSRALIDLERALSSWTSNNESKPVRDSLTKLSEQLGRAKHDNKTDLDGKNDVEETDKLQISSNETRQNETNSPASIHKPSEDDVATFITEVLLEINKTTNGAGNTSDASKQDWGAIDVINSPATVDLSVTGTSKDILQENVTTTTIPATTARHSVETKAATMASNVSTTSAELYNETTIKVEDPSRQDEIVVHPRLGKVVQATEFTENVDSMQNHTQTTTNEAVTTNAPSTMQGATRHIKPTTASTTLKAAGQTTEAITFDQTYAVTDSTAAAQTTETRTTNANEPTQTSDATTVDAGPSLLSFVLYRDSDFDLTAKNKQEKPDTAQGTEEYTYEYDDKEEPVDAVQSPLVEGKAVKPGEDDFDVTVTEADKRIGTEIEFLEALTSVAPILPAATTDSTQNETAATVPVIVTTTPATTNTLEVTTLAATSSTSTVSPSHSGDGDLKASYYSPIDDDNGIASSEDVELTEDEFYFDYEEETTTTLPTTTTTQPARCGTLFNLSSPHLVHDFGRREGNWFTDPLATGAERYKIYVTNFYYGNTLIEFDSMTNFKDFRWSHSHMLPYSWIGTGHIVYNGSFYYNRAFSRNIIKYNLKQRFVSAWGHLRNAVYDSTTPFTWRGHTMVHMAADESGLWVIYAAHSDFGRHANSQHYVVNKINPVDLQTIQSWKTPIRRRGISHLFIICGVVYATDRYDSRRARITHAFDTHTGVRRLLFIPFHNQFAYNVQLLYNPKEKRLYSWDKGHQMLYDISFTY